MLRVKAIFSDFRSLISSDRRLFAVIGAITLIGIALGVVWTHWINTNLLNHSARRSAVQWAETVKKSFGSAPVFETGALPPEAEAALAVAMDHGTVFFRAYNSDGQVVAATYSDDVGQRISEPYFFDVVARGTPHVVTRQEQSNGPVRHYAQAYVPDMRNGVFNGAIEVCVDIAPHVAKYRESFWLATFGLVTLLLASAVIAGHVIFRNIVARKNSEARFRDAIETISEGFAMYDADDRFVLCNARYRELYVHIADLLVPGARFENLLRIGAERGQYPEARGREEEWIAERIKQHRTLSEPIERRLPDGRWVKITETRTRDGSTVGVRTDITHLKTREMQLRESESRLRQIVGSLQEGFILFDAEDRIVMWNEKWLELHSGIQDIVAVGVPFSQLVKTGVARKLFPEAYGREEQHIAERIARHRNPGEPLLRQLHDERWYVIREARTDDGGTFAINFDVTELKNAQAVAEIARGDAVRASNAKSEFLANMSHELRTPLNAIMGFSEVMATESFGPIGSARYREYAANINDSGHHLLALINDMLDLSKVEAGGTEVEEEPIDVVQCLRDCLRLVEQQAREGNVTIDLELPQDLPALWADKRKCKQIVLNLLSNAVKFTPPGGTVTVRASRNAASELVIALADTGIGIADADIPKAFAPFGQIEDAFKAKLKGTGLGLPLTKSLVELHGGTLDLESEIGVGTTVTVRFPPERTIAPSESARG